MPNGYDSSAEDPRAIHTPSGAGQTVYGYDGTAYGVGDRVEIHPGTDFWIRGARFGTVVRLSLTPKDRVHVRLDKVSGTVAGTADSFRLVESCC